MESTEIALPLQPASFMIVGSGLMLLDGQYDPNQLWLSFMERAVFVKPLPPEPKPKNNQKDHRTVAQVAGSKDVRQPLIPFPDLLQITNKQFKLLERYEWPGWEIDKETGRPYAVRSEEPREDTVEWLRENCRGRFNVQGKVISFETSFDAMMAKMRFS